MRPRLRFYGLLLPVLIFVGLARTGAAYGQQAIIFGPETFIRNTGAPETIVRNFSLNLPLQDFRISVQNGEGRHGRVSRVTEQSGSEQSQSGVILGMTNIMPDPETNTRSQKTVCET
jgi:hypothetical protein